MDQPITLDALMRRIDLQIGKSFNRFHVDTDPKNHCYRIKVYCRICKCEIAAQESWDWPEWDKNIETDILNLAKPHAQGHRVSTITLPKGFNA